MMGKTYIAERQVEYWTSRQIEDFFFNAGFNIFVYPVTQKIERYLPADFIFAGDKVKLFGFQYKVLYQNASDYWKLAQRQHETMKKFPWIYYAFSDLTNVTDFRNSLYYLSVKEPTFPFVNKLEKKNLSHLSYCRWAAFYKGLLSCLQGLKIDNMNDLRRNLTLYTDNLSETPMIDVADIFIVNFNQNKSIHFSPQLRDDFRELEN
jgi:hypothetical protein